MVEREIIALTLWLFSLESSHKPNVSIENSDISIGTGAYSTLGKNMTFMSMC